MDKSTLDFYLSHYKWREVAGDSKARNIVTGPVRLAFCYLDPNAPKKGKVRKDGSVPKPVWSVTAIVPPAADVTVFGKVLMEVATAKFGADQMSATKGEYSVPVVTRPVKKQATMAAKGYDGFGTEGVYFDATSQFAVPVVDQSGKEVVFPHKGIYSGMWALLRLRVYTFDNETKGVSAGLVSVQKLADDAEFKGSNGTNEFAAIATHPGAMAAVAAPPADLSAFLG